MNDNEQFKNTPYTLNDIFNQICQYKCYEVNLKRTLLMNQPITSKVCLINSYWFEQWKKISCYEAIKDELNMNCGVQENYQNHIKDYLCVVQKLNNTEILPQEINNSEIFGDFDEMLGRDNIDEETEFELISRDLWNSFYPQNNETLIELDVKYLTKEQDSVYVDLSNNSCYILYWSRDKQKIVKLILIFDNIASKLNFINIVNNIGFGNYYAGNLKEKTEKTQKEKIYDVNLTFDCINKNKRKLLTYEEYKKTKPPVGLNNIKQTCYMNAALQSLFNIPKLTNYLLNNKNAINKLNSVPLLKAYLKTILNLSRKAKGSKTITSYKPEDFHNIIVNENQFMDGASDSIDLVRYFLENMNRQLHQISLSEHSTFEKYFYNINNMNNGNISFQQQVQALNTFINTYASANKSIILNTFYYIEKCQIQCCNCNFITTNFISQMEIVFALEEVRKNLSFNNFKTIINKYNQMCNNNNNSFNGMNNSGFDVNQIDQMMEMCSKEINITKNNKKVTLENCFDYYKNKKTYFKGNNKIKCNNCNNLCDSIQINTLYSLPDYLIINLNRGNENIYDVDITFPEEINLNNLVETKIDNNHYKLICIVTHLGPSGPSGHYISFCYIYNYKKWFKFDDSLVSESSFQAASTSGQTYILFYERQQMIQNNN